MGRSSYGSPAQHFFHIEGPGGSDDNGSQFAFERYLDVVLPADAVGEALGCVCLKWDMSTKGAEDTRPLKKNVVSAAEWYGLAPILSIEGVVHVLRGNMAIHPYTTELPWSEHRFYINRFYKSCYEDEEL